MTLLNRVEHLGHDRLRQGAVPCSNTGAAEGDGGDEEGGECCSAGSVAL